MIKRTAYFSIAYANSFKDDLIKGDNTLLKNRRNKKYVSGNNIYNSYVSNNSFAPKYVQIILDYIKDNNIAIGHLEICTIVAECAIQLLNHTMISSNKISCLEKYLNGSLNLNGYEFLIDDIIYDKNSTLNFIHKYPKVFEIAYQYEESEDVLGLLYISIKNLGTRKATGSYY